MKILQINTVCGVKSTGRIAADLADIIELEGGECKIAYGRESVPERFQKYAHRIATDRQVKKDAILTRLFDNATFNSKGLTKKFIKWIKEYDPDVVHIHNLHGYYINSEILFEYLKESKKPVVWTLHDCWPMTGHCSYFTNIGCEKWRTGCYSCPKKKLYPTSILLDRSKRNWNKKKELFTSLENVTIVTPSKWLADVAKESFLGKYPVYAIPSGVDFSLFKPEKNSSFREKYGLENKKIVLGVATAWGDRKGLDEFCQMAELLGEEYQVVLLGMSEEQIKALPKNVLGLPRTSNIQELAEIYTASDVFVNAGKQETMGMTTVEAMACGTPVVASNLTAVPEVVKENGGLVVNEYTVEEFVRCIKKVLTMELDPISNAQLYEKRGQFNKYIEIYKEILKKQ